MAKYIDSEKLKERVTRLIASARQNDWPLVEDYLRRVIDIIDSLQQEQQEVNLEEFTEKMNAWKARFNSPDDIPIKATMAFTARMFYQYPNVARQWYDGLPKVTQD